MKDDWYTAYAEISAEEAAALFELKHGHAPVEVVDGKTILLAGPIGEHEKKESNDGKTKLVCAAG